MKTVKRICALICVFAICFTLICAPSAHAVGALGGQAAGAWIAAGLVALNIVADVAIGSIGNYFGWQAHPTSTTLLEQDIQYTFPVASQYISDYMNAATIKVDQGVTTIDGVEYDEIFIEPGTFTNGLKTNLFDFKTKWNIISGQSGITLAKGVGFYDGIPVYGDGPYSYKSQFYEINPGTTQIGDHTYTKAGVASNYNWVDLYQPFGSEVSGALSKSNSFPYYLQFDASRAALLKGDKQFPALHNYTINRSYFSNEPFQYDYVSGVVPSEETDIPEDYGLSIQIPHDKLETFYNTYPQYNVDNSTINIQQDQIDIDELTQAIFDQIQSMDDIKGEWKSGEEPVPPVPVDPVENIDENVESINQYQENMNQQVNHMHQDVEAIHQTQQQQQQIQQQMQQTQQDIAENSESIDDTLKEIKDNIKPGEITEKTFDLRELFPFCIPFDIYHLLQRFDATPTAPHVQIPIVIPSIGFSYTMDLDFSAWDPVAAVMRTVELIVYALGLAWATSKVIKW